MKKFFLMLSLSLYFGLIGCDQSKTTGEDEDEEISSDTTHSTIPPEVVNGVLQSIPSPVETAALIEQSGAKYDKSLLNPTENAGNYSTDYYKALNLGIYGADLGYTNIYKQNQDAIFYLDALKEMADGLQLSQFFDFNTIKKLATNSNNLDSLMTITTTNLQKINTYLQEKKRSDQSLLIITGGWLEGLHLICKITEQNPTDKLKEKVGEQKIILGQIKVLFDMYRSDARMKPFIADFDQLKDAYKNVEIIKTSSGESKIEIIDGIPTMVDGQTSTVYIDDTQLKNISTAIEKLRNNIINKK